MENNIKFVPVAPKTYEVRYVENKELGKLFKLASYLGVKTAECSGKELTKAEQDKKLKEIEDKTEALGKGAEKSGAKGEFTYTEESGNKKTGDYKKNKVKYKTK
jgi:hypothetical protein